MFCPECGKKLEDDSKFCEHCGNPIEGDTNEVTPVKRDEPVPSSETPQQKPESQSKGIKTFIVIGIILLICGGLFYLISTRNKYATPEQVRKAAEETAKQYQRHIDEARKQAESNR